MTQEDLMDMMFYNEDTGIFRWKIPPKNSIIKIGDEVGFYDKGYLRVRIAGKCYRLHRLAFLYQTGLTPAQVDHINHHKSDNRWCNLRSVTSSQNGKNQSIHSTNTSGVTGVSFYKLQGMWYAKIYVDGKHVYLGSSRDKEEAIRLRKEGEVLYGFHENHGK